LQCVGHKNVRLVIIIIPIDIDVHKHLDVSRGKKNHVARASHGIIYNITDTLEYLRCLDTLITRTPTKYMFYNSNNSIRSNCVWRDCFRCGLSNTLETLFPNVFVQLDPVLHPGYKVLIPFGLGDSCTFISLIVFAV